MRLTELTSLMRAHFGPVRASSVAHDHVFSRLGGRTVDQAVRDGLNLTEVWNAVCVEFDVPEVYWYGLPDDHDAPH